MIYNQSFSDHYVGGKKNGKPYQNLTTCKKRKGEREGTIGVGHFTLSDEISLINSGPLGWFNWNFVLLK